MARWVETAVFWHGELLTFDRRPYSGRCEDVSREQDGVFERVRVVANPARRFPLPPLDFDFLRVLTVTALLFGTLLVMVALTPKPRTLLELEEPIADAEFRKALLAPSDPGFGIGVRRSRPAELGGGGPRKIVIPKPIGSRVRPAGDELRSYGIISVMSADEGQLAALIGTADFGDSLEGGVVGGVIGGGDVYGAGGLGLTGSGEGVGTGWSTIGTIGKIGDSRCGVLVDDLVDRVYRDPSRRADVRRLCEKASASALDCLERAMSTPRGLGPVHRCQVR